jgi:predicted PhzF superfamily epimerase YddE/YHI9
MKHYHVFTGARAKGNPAKVMLVQQLPDLATHKTLGNITGTTVYIQHLHHNEFAIRWFTGEHPIQRCGHGTLAATRFLQRDYPYTQFIFHSDDERLETAIDSDHYSLTLPTEALVGIDNTHLPFNCRRLARTNRPKGYWIAELNNARAVTQFALTPTIVSALQQHALVITAPSTSQDFDIIFRYFAPAYGANEDSATGSAASILWPFWQALLTPTLRCYQASPEGGLMTLTNGPQDCVLVYGQVTADHTASMSRSTTKPLLNNKH